MNTTKDNIGARHPLYDGLEAKRQVIRDLRGGTDALREKGNSYLPQYPAELDTTYKSRLATATLFNVYAKTERTMTGLVFQDEMTLENVPPAIEALTENIDNCGNHLNVFAANVFDAAFDGAAVILVDAPSVTAPDLETERRAGLRPYWVLYEQSAVTNWQYAINPVSKSRELTLLVVRSVTNEPTGAYTSGPVVRYTEWRLAPVGVMWARWREKESADKRRVEYELEAEGMLERVRQIPAVVVGDLENAPPLMDLARLNIKHYQKESNFDMHEWQAGVSLFFTKGYQEDDNLPVASDFHYKLPVDGEIGWSQVDAGGIETLRDSLTKLEERMAMLGLSMLADKAARVDLTATEALIKNIGETAELRRLAESLEDAIEQAFQFTADYLGLDRNNAGEVILGTAWKAAREAEERDRTIITEDTEDDDKTAMAVAM